MTELSNNWLDRFFGPPVAILGAVSFPKLSKWKFIGPAITYDSVLEELVLDFSALGGGGVSLPTALVGDIGKVLRVIGAGSYGIGAVDFANPLAIVNVAPYANLPQQLGQFRTVNLVSTSNIASLTGVATVIDGVTALANYRVLLTAQTAAADNGIWVVQAGAWVRPGDWSTYTLFCGSWIVTSLGVSKKNTSWRITTSDPITVGTSPVTIAEVLASAGAFGGDLTEPVAGTQKVVALTGAAGTIPIATTGAIISHAATSTAPTIKQADSAVASATGQPHTLQGQNCTGATSTGGDACLTSGTGTTASGKCRIKQGALTVGYFDNNTGKTFRTGTDCGTDPAALSTTLPRPTDCGFSYNATEDNQHRFCTGGNAKTAQVELYNTNGGASSTIGLACKAVGTAHSIAAWQGNAVIEQIGSATNACLHLSSLDGAGNNRVALGRLYRSGALAVGHVTGVNDTTALAQAGLTGPVINLAACTGTLSSVANQATCSNVGGVARLQGHAGVSLMVGTATIVDTTATLHDVRATVGLGLHTQAMADAAQTVSAANSTKNLIVTTGANTAVRALTLTVAPTAGIMKMVRNNCTSFGVTVQFSSGAATATIPPGSSAVVYGDGTNAVILMSGT